MSSIDWSKIIFHWYGNPPNIDNYEDVVRKDCEDNLWGLDRVSDLAFHTICLSNSYEYDIITVWGEIGSENTLYCEYEPKPKWITLKEMQKKTDI